MARPNQEAIDTFISITGVAEDAAVLKLEEHGGDLNAAVNAHFSEGDRSAIRRPSIHAPQDDLMDIDGDPIEVAPPPRRNPQPLLSESVAMNRFPLLDPRFQRGVLGTGSDFTNQAPFVSQPREVREIPIEVKDGSEASGHSGHAPIIEDVTGTEHAQGPDIQGTVIIEDDDNDDISTYLNARATQRDSSRAGHLRPSAPEFDNLPYYSNDIEEEMVRAAIEASKREVQELTETGPQQRQPQAALQEKALREQRGKALREQEKASEVGSDAVEAEKGGIALLNGRPEAGSSSIHDEAEDVEEQPLIRHRSRQTSSGSMESAREAGVVEASPPSSPGRSNIGSHPLHNVDAFSDEWGGISSEEHDEAVMLEAAMFGGIPEGTGYRLPYAPHHFMQNENNYPRPVPRPPSPSLQAQRIIREQQDDEYLASLAADREKEMKAIEEAEAHRLQEEVARKAALEEERRKEEESRRQLEEAQEFERLLAEKEASLPHEPASDDENAVTLLVRMPDGSRRGRRFLKSDNLQAFFDFIDIGRVVKPGTYRLVRPYPRRAFSDGESALTLNELGLASKQEALFLESI
ncbi:plant UBX domain-containing protein 8 isoform X2 [Populus trichocarpa]|uniref:plant UBX domain-containing protein 8 isoform X2 n=1 Tax=Populus trichocarpa TaxID=3694 RepID=UPI000D18957F|nr:plant UBX domain-containing protein 8 isoform X2 [Populus trichocarpa]|eukprot:XP_024449390.1 plant UBX domain-containing protein 8 isoform X2 [Populus trichocarpa]